MACMTKHRLIIFSDLDGCLLNKHDYQWRDAKQCLLQLRDRGVPLVLSSSKTVAEIEAIAAEIPCVNSPFISENGGAICWRSLATAGDPEIQCAGVPRSEILDLLSQLKSQFQFRSFRDLGLSGVMESTSLDADKAAAAMKRQSTEPLLWDDSADQRTEFEQILQQHELTLTKGGRFWHVAGKISKGDALQKVVERYHAPGAVVAAIGDSQIDQSMLDAANVPIGIRVNGILSVNVPCPPGIVPQSEGARGWAEAVTELLRNFE